MESTQYPVQSVPKAAGRRRPERPCPGQKSFFEDAPDRYQLTRETVKLWPDDEFALLASAVDEDRLRRGLRRDPDQVLHSKARALAGELRRRQLPTAVALPG